MTAPSLPDAATSTVVAAGAVWQAGRFAIALDRPRVMGIVNLTPDSFSDGGRLVDVAAAMAHCERLLADGADILDLGGESTRPGSNPVTLDEELARVLPVLREAVRLQVPVSVDTFKTEVMRAALDLGADIVNDVFALRSPGALETVAAHATCGVCLMHMRGDPKSMQRDPVYDDVVAEVGAFLAQRVQALTDVGVAKTRLTIDPGIGFGKTAVHNWTLLQHQDALLRLGVPVIAGWSRKSTLGLLTGRPVDGRLAASVAAALAAVQHGARVVRVHDVAATADALKVWQAAGLPR